ncbi:MAG: ABC transporter ATP-binding protein [Oscillospiraceae bacterium]|nr:ABC transporter ATP-binding protein [Oscillospiraceae bacterium]
MSSILEVKNLSVSFRIYDKGLKRRDLKVISNLNVSVRQGEILAVAGSSGSGKSLLAHAVLGILPGNAAVEGEIFYGGEPLTVKRVKSLRGYEIALVPQSVEYLDPLMKVGKQITKDKSAAASVFKRYKLNLNVAGMYPFQLSGGMTRRVLCATAVVSGAKLIIADEPTPGMSKELADRAMKHFRDLADAGAAVMLITHDLDLALGYADRIAVFYAGTTVETAFAADFEREEKLRHPYTKALWRAIPQNGFQPAPGSQPYAGSLPEGCLFAPRCDMKTNECVSGVIKPRTVRGGEVCCLYAD